jgi:hypothetical protein
MINGLTLKVSAVVTYTDDTSKQILASLDENGNISSNYTNDHDDASSDIDEQTDAMSDFAFTDPDTGLAIDIGSILTGTAKTVSDVVLQISGRVSDDDNTYNDFLYQFNSVEGSTPLFKTGTAYFADAADVAAYLSLMEQTFDAASITLTVT